MQTRRLIVLCHILVGLVAQPTCAQGFPMGPLGAGMMIDGPGVLPPVIMEKLDLTTDQHTRIYQIMENHRSTFQTLFQQLGAVRAEAADKFFMTGKLSTEDFTAQTQQANHLQGQLRSEGLIMVLEIRNVLTTEQLTKAAALHALLQTLQAQMPGPSVDQ